MALIIIGPNLKATGLREDGFWNEVGDMEVTVKRNEKWSHGTTLLSIHLLFPILGEVSLTS